MEDEKNKAEQSGQPSPDSFTIEDIVREFSETGKTPEQLAQEAFRKRQTMRFQIVTDVPSPEKPEPEPAPTPAPEPEPAAKRPSLWARLKAGFLRIRLLPRPKKASAPVTPLRRIGEFLEDNEARCGAAVSTLKLILSWFVTALAAVTVVFDVHHGVLPLSFLSFIPRQVPIFLSLGALAVNLLLCRRYLLRGVNAVRRGHYTAECMLLLISVLTLLRGAADSMACVVSLFLTILLRSQSMLPAAQHRTRAVAEQSGAFFAIACRTDTELPVPAFVDADREDFDKKLTAMPKPLRSLRRLMFAMTALSLAFAIVAALRYHRDFLWAWQIMLLGAYPMGGLYGYVRRFYSAAVRLGKDGIAIAGYEGAAELDTGVFAVTDSDLYPPHSVRLNGAKIFTDIPSSLVFSYVAAVEELAGTELAPLFIEQCELQGGRRLTATNLQMAENGVIGGEVEGKLIQVGSARYFRSIGIELPDGGSNDVLYVAENRRLIALFIVQYQPSDALQSVLSALCAYPSLRIVLATRDILLTPENVTKQYQLPADRLEYPIIRERMKLSAQAQETGGAVLLGDDRFVHFASAVLSARRICDATRRGKRYATIASLLGMLILCLLALIGARTAAGSSALLIYHLLWLLPIRLASGSGNS